VWSKPVENFSTKRHRVAIAGIVTDKVTEKPLRGVRVEITKAPQAYREWLLRKCPPRRAGEPLRPRLDLAHTRPNGLFFFVDLPEGDYALFLFLPRPGRYERLAHGDDCKADKAFELYGDKRYGTARHGVAVAYDEEKAFNRVSTIGLPPTAVRGKVVSAGSKTGLLMAQVRVKGSGESAFTDAEGLYTITGIDPCDGERILEVRARGHRDSIDRVTVKTPGFLNILKDKELIASRG
jgi:hypothetical protein